jgi:uncharacterized damage-inducible protein DinB
MTGSDPKADLHRYLQDARQALLWKLDGLSEYDIRRPMVPTGTNLLGLVKHVASVELGYFGDCFGRPFGERLPWLEADAEPNADMWATVGESREQITGLYRRAWAHSDATISALALDAVGHVPWWPDNRSEVTLHKILVHMIAETDRHAGHADIVRELIDGAAGLRGSNDNMAQGDQAGSFPTRPGGKATGAAWSVRRRKLTGQRRAKSVSAPAWPQIRHPAACESRRHGWNWVYPYLGRPVMLAMVWPTALSQASLVSRTESPTMNATYFRPATTWGVICSEDPSENVALRCAVFGLTCTA